MSEPLHKSTCRIHFQRPASAQCPGCKKYYCSECITEHDGRNTCAKCLKSAHDESSAPAKVGLTWFQPMPIIHFAIALIVTWTVFYLLAQTLASIPDSFHGGTIWE